MLRLSVFLCCLAGQVFAQDLRIPNNALMTAEVVDQNGSYALPIGVWGNGRVPSLNLDGLVTSRSWRIDAAGLNAQQIMRGIREQVTEAQFDVLLDCSTEECGGFDFRFAIDIIRPPKMLVNLRDFRVLTAQKDGLGLMVIASNSRDAGYLQITFVGEPGGTSSLPFTLEQSEIENSSSNSAPIAKQLDENGHATLAGLAFERGSARLGDGPFAVLEDLASYLSANPRIEVALVGHTDSEGSLDGNISLSKRRAGSVLERLVTEYGVPRSQISAEGMGYLSPIANNLTEAGRTANRRVEVIITSVRN